MVRKFIEFSTDTFIEGYNTYFANVRQDTRLFLNYVGRLPIPNSSQMA